MREFVPTLPLGPAPGLDSQPEVRRVWYSKINDWKACRQYDVARAVCYWCLSAEDMLFTDKRTKRGVYKYCSEECRDTAALPRRVLDTPDVSC